MNSVYVSSLLAMFLVKEHVSYRVKPMYGLGCKMYNAISRFKKAIPIYKAWCEFSTMGNFHGICNVKQFVSKVPRVACWSPLDQIPPEDIAYGGTSI